VRQLSTEEELAGNREVVLIFRFVLDGHAELRYGEVLDGHAVGLGRFVSLAEFAGALKKWLERQSLDGVSPSRDTK
jgi:hypothetical protein